MANTYTNLLYHIVFSTKNRRPLIREDDKENLYAYIGGIIRGERGAQLEIGGMPDHHRRKTFQEEFVELLRKHKVDFNEKYLWD